MKISINDFKDEFKKSSKFRKDVIRAIVSEGGSVELLKEILSVKLTVFGIHYPGTLDEALRKIYETFKQTSEGGGSRHPDRKSDKRKNRR